MRTKTGRRPVGDPGGSSLVLHEIAADFPLCPDGELSMCSFASLRRLEISETISRYSCDGRSQHIETGLRRISKAGVRLQQTGGYRRKPANWKGSESQ